jgi:alpha-beta hydrolase superfamily lysophospholipase
MIFKILVSLAMVPVVYLIIASGLILSQWPSSLAPNTKSLDFSGVSSGEMPAAPETRQMRDGYKLPVRFYGAADDENLIVLIHGSGWHGMQFHQLAQALSEHAFVAVPDLRGHGIAPERRGDLDHIGQFEEDLADLIDQIKAENQEVALVGHSSGGGLVVRMAGGPYGDKMDKAVLLAPFLQHDAPTMRPNSGGWAKPLTRRLIGLSMLNTVGITAFNHLTAIQFAMPRVILDGPLGHTATTAYSFRLNTSFAPRRDYRGDIAKLPSFLLIVGSDDEAFLAEEFEVLLKQSSEKGDYHMIDGIGHLDIVNAPQTAKLIVSQLSVP